AVARGHAQFAQAVLLVAEVLGHAADAVHAALEGYALQVALQVVGPLVIRAHELLRVALAVPAELRAAMGAAVLEHVDRAVLGARHHHRRGADIRALVVPRVGDFGFQGHIVPGLAMEDDLYLFLIHGRSEERRVGKVCRYRWHGDD